MQCPTHWCQAVGVHRQNIITTKRRPKETKRSPQHARTFAHKRTTKLLERPHCPLPPPPALLLCYFTAARPSYGYRKVPRRLRRGYVSPPGSFMGVFSPPTPYTLRWHGTSMKAWVDRCVNNSFSTYGRSQRLSTDLPSPRPSVKQTDLVQYT